MCEHQKAILSAWRQKQQNAYCIIPCIQNVQKRKSIGKENRSEFEVEVKVGIDCKRVQTNSEVVEIFKN